MNEYEVELKDLKLLLKELSLVKNDSNHKIKYLGSRLNQIERRVDWVEKLLWLSAGAVISWLVSIVLRSV